MSVRLTLPNDPNAYYRDEQGRWFLKGEKGVPFHLREKSIAERIAKMAKETVVDVPIDKARKRKVGVDLLDRRHLRKDGD